MSIVSIAVSKTIVAKLGDTYNNLIYNLKSGDVKCDVTNEYTIGNITTYAIRTENLHVSSIDTLGGKIVGVNSSCVYNRVCKSGDSDSEIVDNSIEAVSKLVQIDKKDIDIMEYDGKIKALVVRVNRATGSAIINLSYEGNGNIKINAIKYDMSV